ncbi:hypothetical protein FRACYDRAFT_193167 [Fragilariopsis cylindrus CCMP1102]|uniref:FHA domain-containing protein n=1 Tax=Fragilariopsis cylindrus CCMP1102 TaxID=635003 RepID=A0A1E7EYX0_9STRA|nr:hypothetical protein FRACYDRAFT_193167 [Fragilariopsis cylindrus CCMP1102]|eukprot:OEU11171.1 hypothetical protein FRACYDRAFT_193167 [Fragilariopsis cylindrus CCMP1102]
MFLYSILFCIRIALSYLTLLFYLFFFFSPTHFTSQPTEPTEDWKVEQVLHWWLLRANSESEAEYDVIVDGLSKQLHEGKATLWEAHKQVTEIIKDVDMTADNNNNNNNDNNTENVENAQSKNNNKHPPDANNPPDTIHIDVVSGPNEGLFYDLQPRTRTYSWIGRSQGRKFKQKGISLPKDLECSTTHGRFEYTNTTGEGPKFYFVDVGSTNGTQIDGYECEPNVSYVISTGMNILCGKTNLKVTLLSLD